MGRETWALIGPNLLAALGIPLKKGCYSAEWDIFKLSISCNRSCSALGLKKHFVRPIGSNLLWISLTRTHLMSEEVFVGLLRGDIK